MKLLKFFDCRQITTAKVTQQIFRLMFELLEVGTDGKSAIRHTSLLWSCPLSAVIGRKGGSLTEPEVTQNRSGGLSPARGRVAACTPAASIALYDAEGQAIHRIVVQFCSGVSAWSVGEKTIHEVTRNSPSVVLLSVI